MAKIACIHEGFLEVESIVLKCPKYEDVACKKVKEVVKDLEWRVKLYCEWEELKAKKNALIIALETAKELEKIKIHLELEHIKHKIYSCEVHIRSELEEFKEKVECVAEEINPIDKIKAGFLKFKKHFEHEKEHYAKIAECHTPKYLIFSSCDSRVDPCKILNLEIGEAIVIRNVGGFIPACGEEGPCPSIGAAIEYAIKQLKVEHILALGHSKCENIHALVKSLHEEIHEEKVVISETFKSWFKIVENTCKKVKETNPHATFEEQCTISEKECINYSLQNCLTYPIVKEAITEKKVSIHAGYYDITKCTFDSWNLDIKLTKEHTHA